MGIFFFLEVMIDFHVCFKGLIDNLSLEKSFLLGIVIAEVLYF